MSETGGASNSKMMSLNFKTPRDGSWPGAYRITSLLPDARLHLLLNLSALQMAGTSFGPRLLLTNSP